MEKLSWRFQATTVVACFEKLKSKEICNHFIYFSKGALNKYFNYWRYRPKMPHHIEDGNNVGSTQPGHVTPDSQNVSLCTRSDTSRFENVDSNKDGTLSDVHLIRHASKKFQNWYEQMILLLSQVSWIVMLWTNLDYWAQIGQPAIIKIFPGSKSDGTCFLSFTAKNTIK